MEKSSTPTLPAAAPIPLPTSHIKRTHSELQLAQDQLLADYQDNQIYKRILSHMDNSATVTYDIESGIFELEL
eukprot:scaffold1680_cov139-Skeletonema_menzelii.AAC.1